MTAADRKDPLFSAAVLKMSLVQKGLADTPGFRVVYVGALKELGISDDEVNAYIADNHDALLRHLQSPPKA